MEAIISAVLGDLVSRSISFVIDNYYQREKSMEESLQRLCSVLLRIQAIVEEAEGRHITNKGMLQQLQILREAMYKGCYLLDTLGYRMLLQKMTDDQARHHPFALTKLSPAKHFCFPTRRINMALQSDGLKEVQKMLESLHDIINGMAEFVAFLKSYSLITRQPYIKYLYLEKCMFGRQAEMEKIISFLLQPEPPGVESLQVLPIIGPPRVGKSTLVEHVCYDERLADDFVLDKRQRRKLHSSRSQMPPGSKIIVTSRSESILRLGTSEPIRVKFLSQEAYWYFFKVMAFGSTNPDEHPELASIAMEISADMDGSFLSANIVSRMLRANFHAQFWRKILELQRDYIQRHLLLFGEHPHTLVMKNQPIYLWSMSDVSMCIKVHSCEKLYHQNEVPKIKLHEVLTGTAEAQGKFEIVVWRSCIPPYHSFMMSSEAPCHMMAKNKRPYSMCRD
ncbi:hypothetical protein EJB05_17165 [Eragrostis curvula]|uniref:Disease resistance N-terminal domain-containing protein n=1 Tax=Eragrostis curvula TaxID=38414 RepID=A0A5J9VIB8_9POAL|nr:hypothetical protein EJB05_17165 [Eragrostis curvula]